MPLSLADKNAFFDHCYDDHPDVKILLRILIFD